MSRGLNTLTTWKSFRMVLINRPNDPDSRSTPSLAAVDTARLQRQNSTPGWLTPHVYASFQVLEESKCLVRSFLKSVLEDVNEKECVMLKQLWSSSKGLDSLFSYLQDKIYEV